MTVASRRRLRSGKISAVPPWLRPTRSGRRRAVSRSVGPEEPAEPPRRRNGGGAEPPRPRPVRPRPLPLSAPVGDSARGGGARSPSRSSELTRPGSRSAGRDAAPGGAEPRCGRETPGRSRDAARARRWLRERESREPGCTDPQFGDGRGRREASGGRFPGARVPKRRQCRPGGRTAGRLNLGGCAPSDPLPFRRRGQSRTRDVARASGGPSGRNSPHRPRARQEDGSPRPERNRPVVEGAGSVAGRRGLGEGSVSANRENPAAPIGGSAAAEADEQRSASGRSAERGTRRAGGACPAAERRERRTSATAPLRPPLRPASEPIGVSRRVGGARRPGRSELAGPASRAARKDSAPPERRRAAVGRRTVSPGRGGRVDDGQAMANRENPGGPKGDGPGRSLVGGGLRVPTGCPLFDGAGAVRGGGTAEPVGAGGAHAARSGGSAAAAPANRNAARTDRRETGRTGTDRIGPNR